MTTVESEATFREALVAAYRTGNLVAADSVICRMCSAPERWLTTPARGRLSLFCLELWAAVGGQPHGAIRHVRPEIWLWPYQRLAANSKMALTALFWLSQSPLGAGLAEDTHQLRPRLFVLAQREAEEESRRALGAFASGERPARVA